MGLGIGETSNSKFKKNQDEQDTDCVTLCDSHSISLDFFFEEIFILNYLGMFSH